MIRLLLPRVEAFFLPKLSRLEPFIGPPKTGGILMYSLTTTKTLSRNDVLALLNRAQECLGQDNLPILQGKVAILFTEPSTRTSLSFQMAAQQLGLQVLNFSVENSSFCKGETLQDTLETIAAMGVDIAVVRAKDNWPAMVDTTYLPIGLINAGSGVHEHPTQALLDALTIQQQFKDFNGLKVTIVGDILHSRVARSNIDILTKLGAKVQLAGPPEFSYNEAARLAPWVDFDDALIDSDVIMMLRIQHERHQEKLAISREEYHQKYGLTSSRVARMKKTAIIMHPGPVNRGVEIANEVIHHPQSRILTQVRNGVGIRTALLERCLRGERFEKLVSA
jgi:aspartate carbamoyltransferase catalytic subunit